MRSYCLEKNSAWFFCQADANCSSKLCTYANASYTPVHSIADLHG